MSALGDPDRSPPTGLSGRQIVRRAVRLPTAHRFRLAWRLAASPRVPLRARLPLAGLLIYLAMPLDIIPDFLPVIGQLDDMLVAGIAVWWFLRVFPADVAIEEIERLERTALSPVERYVPWLLALLLTALAIASVIWLVKRR